MGRGKEWKIEGIKGRNRNDKRRRGEAKQEEWEKGKNEHKR